jgi:hypothetical protein
MNCTWLLWYGAVAGADASDAMCKTICPGTYDDVTALGQDYTGTGVVVSSNQTVT